MVVLPMACQAARRHPEHSATQQFVIIHDRQPASNEHQSSKSNDRGAAMSTDLAPMVDASLEVMERDSKKMRGERPFVFTNLKTGQGLDTIVRFIQRQGLMQ
jgi:hypothetical protein